MFDGEAIQIKPYSDEEIQALFDNKNCFLGKLAASCTEIQQPCDVGDICKRSKLSNKNIDDSHGTPNLFNKNIRYHQHTQKTVHVVIYHKNVHIQTYT